MRNWWVVSGGVVAVIVLAAGFVWLSGSAVAVTPDILDLGDAPAGEDVDDEIVVRNAGSQPFTLVAPVFVATPPCSITEPLPTLRPGESATLTLACTTDGYGYHGHVVLLTDRGDRAVVKLAVGDLLQGVDEFGGGP